MDRTAIQKSLASRVINGERIIAKWATNTGKTNVALFAILEVFKHNRDAKCLIVVAERSHKSNWKMEMEKTLGIDFVNRFWNKITIICYNSLKNIVNSEWDLMCLDEGHHVVSELRQSYLSTIKAKCILVLSATIKRDAVEILEHLYGRFTISNISLQDSIDSSFVPEPRIICIPLTLNDSENTETLEISLGYSRRPSIIDCTYNDLWSYLKTRSKYPNTKLRVHCTQQQKYSYICKQIEYWNDRYNRYPEDKIAERNFLRWGLKRKKYLGELKSDKAKSLIDNLRKKKVRFLCFCTTVKQAKLLGEQHAISSDNNRSLKIVDKFNKEKIDDLFTVGMLVEGVSLNNIQAGVIIQLDGDSGKFIQKFGRTLRSKDPVQYILYYKNTRDEEYLNRAIIGINPKYIEYD